MIKVGYLISYDFEFVFLSIKQLYNDVDRIFLAVDKERKTWSGNSFFVSDSFFEEIKRMDINHKIEIYEDNFFVPANQPMQNETRERKMLANKMGEGWCVQLDADEYIYDFKSVKDFLNQNDYLLKNVEATHVQIQGVLITIFKVLDDGILYIENDEKFNFITNLPDYTIARNIKHLPSHFSNIKVIHQSWGRKNEEVLTKIRNWGHRDDFDTAEFYEFWKNLSSSNYKTYKNFHPLTPNQWNELKLIPLNSLEEFIVEYSKQHPQQIIQFTFSEIVQLKFRLYFSLAKKYFHKLF
jgi:hypothetical protein